MHLDDGYPLFYPPKTHPDQIQKQKMRTQREQVTVAIKYKLKIVLRVYGRHPLKQDCCNKLYNESMIHNLDEDVGSLRHATKG